MRLEGSHTFNAPRQLVWEALHDTEVLGSILPGADGLEALGDDKYATTMKVKVGPVQGVFKGTVELSEINEPESYHMDVDGRGAPGFVKGSGDIRLEAAGENETVMNYGGDAQVGGRLASVGQRLVETSAKAIVRQSLEGLEQIIMARAAAAASAGEGEAVEVPQVEVKAPSEADYAKAVAKEVANDLIPAEQRPLVIGGAVAVLAIIAYIVFRAVGA